MNELIEPQNTKRKRLSYACNYCRSKKTRCDEKQPCHACELAGIECITTDKRRDGAPVAQRRRTGAPVSTTTQITPISPDCNSLSVTSAEDRPRLWSQCWSRERWITGRLPMIPRLDGNSMLELSTEWLDLAFYRLGATKITSVSPIINNQFTTLLPRCAPDLPSSEKTRDLINSYFETLHRLFPFVHRATVEGIYNRNLAQWQESAPILEDSTPSHQALLYLIITAGVMVMPASEGSRASISSYIGYCNSLLGHLVATRSPESVQAILLFAIILRSCDRLVWAWDVLAMGVSMAQSIEINHTCHMGFDAENPIAENQKTTDQTWWCMYVFEKFLAFESGRPSMIWDRGLSGAQTRLMNPEKSGDSEFRRASIGLANILHEIQERSARAWRREEWLPQSVDEAIEEKLQTGGELILLLEDWQNNLPNKYRPGGTPMSEFQSDSQVAFLSFYYYTAMILLSRSTLIITREELHEVVNRFAAGKPWKQQLLNGPTMAIEAARDMVKLWVTLVDSGVPNYLTTFASPLAAVYTIAVHIICERKSLLIRSDYEMMKAAMQLTKQAYYRHGTACNIDEILNGLDQHILACLEGRAPELREEASASSTAAFMGESYSTSRDPSIPPMGFSWGPTSLDWAGWDWNDLSHLFDHSE
ncbi:hypothetical protein N7520_000967 [Penicillium odoratum]|uniref:uncharacterized protein n=1 Tax=Penicillium odoratum TaxID=1167516 RepID=UPI002546A482|nr:uncharacterized protein N7520_000967 [Penicillium odoratum]KAJ5777721.1 hypothetical protein N7520_000967 [Penicillium odoratum]